MLIDWDVLNDIHVSRDLKKMLKVEYMVDNELIFTCRAWLRAFNVQEDVYHEWCLEFFSTLFMNESIKTDNITKEVCVWFRLCEQNF